MKHFLFFSTLCYALLSCEVSSKEKRRAEPLVITGSETMFPLLIKESKGFEQMSLGSEIEVVGGGSETGINALLFGKTNIAMASRSLKIIEKLNFQEGHKDLNEKIIAFDALAIIVNKDIKISKLTREQIENIYIGNIKNWRELGGEDIPITLLSRDTTSGTYDFFNEFVLKNAKLHSNILRLPTNEALMKKVKETKGAISYIGLGYLNDQVKSIFVSYDKGETFVEPSQNNVQDQTYPIIRPLYIYYMYRDEEIINPFIKFILSKEGQELVLKSNYIPIHNFNKFIYQNIILPL